MATARARNPKLTPAALAHWREKQKGWTKHHLARALRVSQTTITQWENGSRFPPYYLGYALNWLMTHDPT